MPQDDKGFSRQAAKIVIMKFCAKDVKNGRATWQANQRCLK